MSLTVKREFLDAISRTLDDCSLLQSVQHVYVGFSGGADSTALLLAMQVQPVSITAVHLNHRLRGIESDRDAEWCREFCAERDLEFIGKDLDVPAHRLTGENLEAAARRCRLNYWRALLASDKATERGNAVIALGHHADDALEDLFLRLGRGSAASGLTALRPQRTIDGVTFIRPLLNMRRSEILAFLEAEGITDWRRDRTNRDTTFRRNAIRHKLLPQIREIWGNDAGFMQALAGLRDDARFLENAAAEFADWDGDTRAFAAIPRALQPRVLRAWLSTQLGYDFVPRRAAIERIRAAVEVTSGSSVEIPLDHEVKLEIDRDTMRIKPEKCEFQSRQWSWREDPVCRLPEIGLELRADMVPAPAGDSLKHAGSHCEYFDPSRVPDRLSLRPWQAGDRMVPFGHSTERKLKDVFNAADVQIGRASCRERVCHRV